MSSELNRTPFSKEYVALIAFLVSIAAIGTDLILPAFDLIGAEFQVRHENDVHFLITSFFLGMAIGQMIVGPLSDRFGRKPIILMGYALFVFGCLLSIFANSWSMMIVGRLCQGMGAAAPRVVTLAMVRDEYEGRKMAQILSIVMALFIVVPMLAPALGQLLVNTAGWKAIFAVLIVLSMSAAVWLQVRQSETLALSHRRPISFFAIGRSLREILTTRVVVGYTLASGLVFGAFIAYLGSAQQIFQETFLTGDYFAAYFALASASIGIASVVNAKLVIRFGMRRLTQMALFFVSVVSGIFCLVLVPHQGIPPFEVFIVWQLLAFFGVGIVFGNLSALSLEPLGHMAGLGAAFVGSISLFISLPLAGFVGRQFDGTVFPLVTGFSVLGFAAFLVVIWTNRSAS